MANGTIEIPFYAARDGAPLIGAAAGMAWNSLRALAGVDKSAWAPPIEEIGGGWYKFAVAYGAAPFDAGDLAGVIDVDASGALGLANAERYIPVEVRLDFYALSRLVNPMSQDKLSGDMHIYDSSGNSILKLAVTESTESVVRNPS
jgi:hypothetical protein